MKKDDYDIHTHLQELDDTAEAVEEDEEETAMAVLESILLRKASKEYLVENFEGEDGLLLLVDGEGREARTIVWQAEAKDWVEAKLGGQKKRGRTLIGDIYHNYFTPSLRRTLASQGNKNADAYPLLQSGARLQKLLADEFISSLGEGEEALAKFDTAEPPTTFDYGKDASNKPIQGRFLFGGIVWEIHGVEWDANGAPVKYRLVEIEGGNRKEYFLRVDTAPMADEKEWRERRDAMLEFLRGWFPHYDETTIKDGKEIPVKASEAKETFTGNHLLDDLFLLLATAWTPPIGFRPVAVCPGEGGTGKSGFWRGIGAALGAVMSTELHPLAFTKGDGTTFGTRLSATRKGFLGFRIVAAVEGGGATELDEAFIKPFAGAAELSTIGGLWENDLRVALRCVGIQVFNKTPRNRDSGQGAARRQRIYKFSKLWEKNGKKMSDHLGENILDGRFGSFGPVICREVFENIRRLIEEFNCKLPDQHPLLHRDWLDLTEEAAEGIGRSFARCFNRLSDLRDDKDSIPAAWQKPNKKDRPSICVGQLTAKAAPGKSVAVEKHSEGPVKSKHQPCHGFLLALRFLQTSGGVKENDILDSAGAKEEVGDRHWEMGERGAYKDVLHSDYFVERLWDYYRNRAQCIELLQCIYSGGALPVEQLLTEKQQSILRGEEITPEDSQEAPAPGSSNIPEALAEAAALLRASPEGELSRKYAEITKELLRAGKDISPLFGILREKGYSPKAAAEAEMAAKKSLGGDWE